MTSTARSISKPAPHGRVVGRYLMYGQIGSGGTATVHFGRRRNDAGRARTVAIKRLHAHLSRDPYFVAQFSSEADLTARLQHPNIASLLDVVKLDDGELLLVMDYIHGETLGGLLGICRRREEVIPPAVASAIITGVLEALHAAHEMRGTDGAPLELVHGDVSAHNVIVGADGGTRLLDFGVARAGVAAGRDRRVIGTLAYMAPERLRGGIFDRRSDLFGVGVLLWELLTVRRLFSGCDGRGKRSLAQVPPPSHFAPTVPPMLDDLVLSALRGEVDRRPQDARVFADALAQAMPPASQAEVVAWINLVAGARLRDRAEELSRIERSSVPPLLDEQTDLTEAPTSSYAGPRLGLCPMPAPQRPLAALPAVNDEPASGDEAPTILDAHPPLRNSDPRHSDPRHSDPRPADPRQSDPRHADPRHSDPRHPDSLPRAGVPLQPAARLALWAPTIRQANVTPATPAPAPVIETFEDLPAVPRHRVGGFVVSTAAACGFALLVVSLWRGSGRLPAESTAMVAAARSQEISTSAAVHTSRPVITSVVPAPESGESGAATATALPTAVTGESFSATTTPPPPAVAYRTPTDSLETAAPLASTAAPAPTADANVPANAPRPPASSASDDRRLSARVRRGSTAKANRITGGAGRARVIELHKRGLEAYDRLDRRAALTQLTAALRLSETLGARGADLRARTHINLGVVLAGGFKQRGLAAQHFRRARSIAPDLLPTRALVTPEIEAALREAGIALASRS